VIDLMTAETRHAYDAAGHLSGWRSELEGAGGFAEFGAG
jgi:hypothetical protein